MHLEAYAAIAHMVMMLPEPPCSVIEVGSRNVNGSVRPLFPGASYVGLDRQGGRDVEWIGDARDYQPPKPVDAIVCAEVLEHDRDPLGLLRHVLAWPAHACLLTWATPDRAPHGSDGGPVQPGEWYAGVPLEPVQRVIEASGWRVYWAMEDPARGDAYLLAVR